MQFNDYIARLTPTQYIRFEECINYYKPMACFEEDTASERFVNKYVVDQSGRIVWVDRILLYQITYGNKFPTDKRIWCCTTSTVFLNNIEPDQYVLMGIHKLYVIYLNNNAIEACKIEPLSNIEWYLTQPYEQEIYFVNWPVDICITWTLSY